MGPYGIWRERACRCGGCIHHQSLAQAGPAARTRLHLFICPSARPRSAPGEDAVDDMDVRFRSAALRSPRIVLRSPGASEQRAAHFNFKSQGGSGYYDRTPARTTRAFSSGNGCAEIPADAGPDVAFPPAQVFHSTTLQQGRRNGTRCALIKARSILRRGTVHLE